MRGTAILIEAKVATCDIKTKYSGDFELMKKYLESKLVGTPTKRKGVWQLLKAIENLKSKPTAFLPPCLAKLKCLVLYVINRPAAQGKQTRPSRSVFASLEFRAASRSTVVNRACWVGKGSNEITIGVNETEHILVGLPKEDEGVTYHNPNRFSELHTDFWTSRQVPVQLEERTLNWGEGASYTVDVRIICNDSGPFSGETLAHRQFTMERKGISLSAKMLE